MTHVDGSGPDVRAPLVAIARCSLCGSEAIRLDPAAPVDWLGSATMARPIPVAFPFRAETHVCGDWRLGRIEEVGTLCGIPGDPAISVWVEIDGPVYLRGFAVVAPLSEVWPIGGGG